mmetsp:Transcript_12656/g.34562  ORF Transcript_12656/g.34562 Transcript_12656/m.34562 type:complete len:86 (-) Transcript_12656:793-1050(-)
MSTGKHLINATIPPPDAEAENVASDKARQPQQQQQQQQSNKSMAEVKSMARLEVPRHCLKQVELLVLQSIQRVMQSECQHQMCFN